MGRGVNLHHHWGLQPRVHLHGDVLNPQPKAQGVAQGVALAAHHLAQPVLKLISGQPQRLVRHQGQLKTPHRAHHLVHQRQLLAPAADLVGARVV
ncbi:hypothetical protein SDC9_203025 [bioreactor metagenome]|uniref:Uncharacterized protein n=1 Tax=bioreactor metagenome TaxID=1076179 RepID=A0A645J777_9ZZZZ